ncbi:hypothetical protein HYT24_01255 [Candidatus Pacearchaeota archaeon]|nr:hypothetical protein [Candidatus Pacearchaeota archaeon]
MVREIIQLLGSVGISEIEAEVYLDLLVWGNSKANDIAKRIHRHRSNVYDALRRLTEKGFISTSTESNVIIYNVGEPTLILNHLKEKEEALKKEIEGLQQLRADRKTETVSLAYGMPRVQEVLQSLLEQGKEILIQNPPNDLEKSIGERLVELEKERGVEEKTPVKVLYFSYYDVVEKPKREHVEIKYLDFETDSKVTMIICDEYVFYMVFRDPVTVILVKDPDIAKFEAFRFRLKWKKAKKSDKNDV